MKKLALLVLALGLFASCTPEALNDENTANSTDPAELCPPSDRNCNGIPDSQE